MLENHYENHRSANDADENDDEQTLNGCDSISQKLAMSSSSLGQELNIRTTSGRIPVVREGCKRC
jgi:hypothetical protein